jgi:UDP-N-acetylmuramate dehydrogenase
MQLIENYALKSFNSFGIAISAKYYCNISSNVILQQVLAWNKKQQHQILVLGGGSNILFTKNFEGLVLHNALKGIKLVRESEHNYYVKAMAGESWHEFVQYCVKQNYAGVENLSLIPGNIGATPMQNIGAYGVEIKDVFYELEAVDIETQNLVVFKKGDCNFGYRDSVFKQSLKNKFIITSVTYELPKLPKYNTSYGAIEMELEKQGVKELSISAIAKAVIAIRQSKLPDPQKIGNAGSFFKNPVLHTEKYLQIKKAYPTLPGYADGASTKLPAGWLIEQCGWKGYRKEDAGCYALQALVLVNYGSATGKEIYDLSEQIIQTVQHKFGIVLEREVNIY